MELRYQHGFGNTFASEAVPGALPTGQNAPNPPPYGLVIEQINGTGFTVERALNQRTWMYRLRPQIRSTGWREQPHGRFVGDFSEGSSSPEVLRYRPIRLPTEPTDWLRGLVTFAGTGDASLRQGMAIHLYAANRDMVDTAFVNIDGDLLIVPQHGRLHLRTELGRLEVEPGELAVVPRGIRFSVSLPDGEARGWVAELFDGHLRLPERGPVGANGMANERHFRAPVADFVDEERPFTILARQGGRLWSQVATHDPFDVVAWYGNHVPYAYDLRLFNSLGSVSFDHPDPSLLTVLTAPIDTHGRSALDVAVFLGRWDVAEHTFRPPFFHRNSAIEFNGVVANTASSGPWQPGAFSYTPYLSPHGISTDGYAKELARDDESPVRMSDESIWIQFESAYLLKVMPWMLEHADRDRHYLDGFGAYAPEPSLP
jgi:homogentisate 1,2-dioxygenase